MIVPRLPRGKYPGDLPVSFLSHVLHILIGGQAQRVPRMNSQITVRLDDELDASFEEYLDQFEYEPEKSEVVRRALREFFERELGQGLDG